MVSFWVYLIIVTFSMYALFRLIKKIPSFNNRIIYINRVCEKFRYYAAFQVLEIVFSLAIGIAYLYLTFILSDLFPLTLLDEIMK